MNEDQPQETIITSTDVQRQIGEITRQAAVDGVRFIVQRNGFPTLAIISATDYRLLVQDQKRLAAIMLQAVPARGAPKKRRDADRDRKSVV